ncbi:C-factor [Dactylellina cionopaga]|nr:C-factor [Dactylellina cionopaga]
MAFALVTPSSRGIGLALTRQLLSSTPSSLPIIATARRDLPNVRDQILSNLPSSSASSASDRLDLIECDLESESSIASLASHIQSKYIAPNPKDAHLRLGFCIPGILFPERSPEKIDYDSALHTLKLNLLAPLLLAKYLTPFLPRKSTNLHLIHGLNPHPTSVLAFMSARVGSISDNRKGGWYSYRSSKAGLNQLVKTLDIHLKARAGDKAICVGLHPGTVKTDLSREFWETIPKAELFEKEFSAERLIEVVKGVKVETGRGLCWDWKGEEILP